MTTKIPENPIVLKSLKDWQESLLEHFSTLSKSRKENGLSVFALEHGLSNAQLDVIFESLRKELISSGINRSHWLIWVVYATEIGYGYDGDEYWQSFETATPNWSHHLREDIRWAFEEFQKKFTGVKPVGTWANHFSIIAWPITHAILPRDLLSHFARLLYSTRYKLKKINFDDSKTIGHLLSANSYHIHSNRFQNFLQQEELVGRIALAMLDDTTTQNNNRIYQPTLKRIVTDLEKRSNAKEWMTAVRRDIKTRILGANTHKNQGGEHKIHAAQKKSFVKPRLTLRRSDQDSWNAFIQIPNVSDSLYDSSLLGYFRSARIKLAGVDGTWIPADELLYGIQRKLSSWPSPECVITFDKQNVSVGSLIKDECKITEGPYWLFRIGPDGIAIEIATKVLRPGLKYIVTFKDDAKLFQELLDVVKINCGDVSARLIEIPDTISIEDERKYISLGFQIQKSIKIVPVGLPARAWDGEGISEWLTSETPCFSVTHDHPVKEYQISIGTLTSSIRGKPAGVPTFFKLPKLPAGRHTLLLLPKVAEDTSTEGTVLLDVRDPASWTPGSTLHNGLTSFLDPPDDNLDSFLLEKTHLKIQGPASRNVKINFDFYAGNELLKTTTPKTFPLPVVNNELHGMCAEALKDESILVAKRMKLVINADELGKRVHTFQRDVAPLRWYFKTQGDKGMLRLIDETDGPDALQVKLFSFDDPINSTTLDAQEWIRSKNAQDIKGLMVASRGKHEHAIILSRLQNNKSLEGVSVFPKITRSKHHDRLSSIVESVRLAKKWYDARCVNLIAHLHRQKVLDIMTQDIFMNLCGSDWRYIESALINSVDFKVNIPDFSNKIENKSLGNVIRFRLETKIPEGVRPDEEKSWFIAAVDRCNVCHDRALAYFAIKFASNPLQIDEYFSNDFKVNVSKLLQQPMLIRAARFYTLGVSKVIDPNKADSFILPAGWKW